MEFLEGGTISGSSVVNSHMVNSTIQASTFEAGRITALLSVDEISATIIAQALSKLDPGTLEPLAKALVQPTDFEEAKEPVQEDGDISRTHYGNGKAVLGTPDKWLNVSGGAVPMYKQGA